MQNNTILIRYLGIRSYKTVFQSMHNFTYSRNKDTTDEIWLVEHFPVFTQGHSGKPEHLLKKTSNIPVIQSDRGGQITYHGPGQQIVYVLLNLKRCQINAHELVILLEKVVINMLHEYRISAYSLGNAPGVYVEGKKICSLALRIYKGCSFHGFALNINMDLTPFLYINPCGYTDIKMTQMSYWDATLTTDIVRPKLIKHFFKVLKI